MQKDINWKGLDAGTTENCTISEEGDMIIVRSEISGGTDMLPIMAEYTLKLDKKWQVLEFQLTAQTGGTATQCYAMERDPAGNWKGQSGIEYPEYHGCQYIDISLTPFTNTLPVNGLKLIDGESHQIDVVYFDVVDEEVRRDTQRYTKLSSNRYRFENDNGRFVAEIHVDDNGFVINYPQLFEII